MFKLTLEPSPTESRHDVPDGFVAYRCGADDIRILNFPEDEVLTDLAKEMLDCHVPVLRRYDTCVIFAFPTGGAIESDDFESFREKLKKLLLEDPENQVRVTTRDKYSQ